jgi:D-alanyl-D-alanine dipeptidase
VRAAVVIGAIFLTACGRHRYGLTELSDYVLLDIRYASHNNFTKHRLYWEGRCFLREETARKLIAADEELHSSGLGLVSFRQSCVGSFKDQVAKADVTFCS